jgi:hypothetical protein
MTICSRLVDLKDSELLIRRYDNGASSAFFDLDVKARNDEESSMTIYLLWDDPFWLILTAICVEAEVGGMTQLKPFPERRAKTFGDCIAQLNAATDDLFASHQLLIEWLATREPNDRQPVSGNRGSLRSSRILPSGVKLQ